MCDTSVQYLPSSHQAKLISLIGNRCLVQCQLDDVAVEALWDTGAQASLINDEWRKQHLPDSKVRPLEELLGDEPLVGLAANQTPIPFDGWVEVQFQLTSPHSEETLLVPMLVSGDSKVAEQPIIGFNVIEELLNRWDKGMRKSDAIQKVSRLCEKCTISSQDNADSKFQVGGRNSTGGQERNTPGSSADHYCLCTCTCRSSVYRREYAVYPM